jgi:hypothetical protein
MVKNSKLYFSNLFSIIKYLSGRYGLPLLKYVTELFAAQQYDYNVSIRKATIFTDKTGPLTEI